MNKDGFTLIEMLVVVVIILMISTMAMPSISSYFQLSLNSATRDLATTIKQAYNSAVVTGKVHRLAYDLKSNSYWVESGPSEFLLNTQETSIKENRRKKFGNDSEKESPSVFKLETTITRKKIILPRGVIYEDLVTQETSNPIVTGTTYTHFFPHGLTEQTIIHLQDTSNHHASLVITPLIGMTDLYDRYVNAKEIFEK